MKKVLLSMAVVALLTTSCKKAKEAGSDIKEVTVEAADKAADATKDAANAVVEGAENAVDATKDAANSVIEGAKDAVSESKDSALEGVTIPEFENEEVTKHLTTYANYAKEYIESKGDVLKNAKLAKEGVALAKKGKELLATLDGEAATKFKSVMNAIQSKMAPAK
tara:strand:- start:16335 stop:16832 length:498 start_codon:yes stop_codon:yes gene_type:complete